MTALNFADKWLNYYTVMAGRPPRDTLLTALANFEAESLSAKAAAAHRWAIDLGCGEGRDTVELLRRGWRVLAIDGTPEGIQQLLERFDGSVPDSLETQVARFESMILPQVNLINASFSLPFCQPEAFPQLWQQVVAALLPGGRFAGQLFGDRDTWASIPTHTHHTREQVEALLAPFCVEQYHEVEEDGITALNEAKHWHVFHIVARKL